MWYSSVFVVVTLLGRLSLGYTVAPPGPTHPDTIQDCTYWVLVTSTDTCQSITTSNAITVAQFRTYNPSVGSTCVLTNGYAYCVEQNYGVPPATTASSSTTAKTTSTGISTPSPIQTGMASSCNSFYLVATGDQCGTIASSHGISLANFYSWNPAVGSSCTTLIASDYVCVGIVGGTSLTTTTTRSTNGISTPQPIQTGMVTKCNSFYLVVSGDQCGNIASAKGISLTNFYAWNPAVGSTCATLVAGDYVCVGIIGGTTSKVTTTTTTTIKTNGISTPTPTQTGMVGNCNTFYLVVSGDQCGTIASAKGISLAHFYAWNPAVGSTCASLWVGYYVCVNVVGGTTTSPPKPTTTSAGNGIATPTPTQAGMSPNCKKFHLVVSGDTCAAISSTAGITLANFYSWNTGVGSNCQSLWLGYYVCIGT